MDDDLQELLNGGWVNPSMAWSQFFTRCPEDMTVGDLLVKIAMMIKKATCRCGLEIWSYDDKSWFHPKGGYKQCDSALGILPASSARKATPAR